jgi:hypothetical protein
MRQLGVPLIIFPRAARWSSPQYRVWPFAIKSLETHALKRKTTKCGCQPLLIQTHLECCAIGSHLSATLLDFLKISNKQWLWHELLN